MTGKNEGRITADGRKLHCEFDKDWDWEQCPVTKVWWKVKLVFLSTWTVYQSIGHTGYQTPVYCGKDEADAKAWLHSQ